jgi:uncharacterized membrane protein
MTTFTVWKFEDPTGAERAASALREAQDDGLVKVLDHAVVTWPEGESEPRTKHSHDDSRRGAGWGAFLGLVTGAMFALPVVGAVGGAAVGAAIKKGEGTGITKDELQRIREQLSEGTSALFAVTDEGNLDRLGERFRGMDKTLISTNLTDAERETLIETFGGE